MFIDKFVDGVNLFGFTLSFYDSIFDCYSKFPTATYYMNVWGLWSKA
jgi:hypothetical protein